MTSEDNNVGFIIQYTGSYRMTKIKLARCVYKEIRGNSSIRQQLNLHDIIIQGYAITENSPSSSKQKPLQKRKLHQTRN